MEIFVKDFTFFLILDRRKIFNFFKKIEKILPLVIVVFLFVLSLFASFLFYNNGLSLAYNDARSHLNIARRVVEGLKTGAAQLGSVWLPLPHVLMLPTIWNDFFWHSGASGTLVSLVSFILTGIFIYRFLEKLKVRIFGRIFGVLVFSTNLNILYLTSTAMTEMLLLATQTLSVYYLVIWARKERMLDLLKSAFWVMLATLTRYDGWFLFVFCTFLIGIIGLRKRVLKEVEGYLFFFLTLAGFGIFLWFLWNLVIFKDPLYFVYGPYSAYAQQLGLEKAGELLTKGNLLASLKTYFYAIFYNLYTIPVFIGFSGIFILYFDKSLKKSVRLATLALLAPILFNIIALYLGHSVLFLPEVVGKTWFNVRYGMLAAPAICIGIGFIVDRLRRYSPILIGLILFTLFFAFLGFDAVTIDDALYGASQKNVKEVSSWLRGNVSKEPGFVLISAASHDAIIFSSGLPMKRFIHEGTGDYWKLAVENPNRWVKWIVMRTYDMNDLTYKEVHDASGFKYFELVEHYPFADIYQLKKDYWSEVVTTPVLSRK